MRGFKRGFADTFIFVVTRLNANGTTDVSFGQNGKAFNKNGSNGNGLLSELTSAFQQPDGKILLAGVGYDGLNNDFSVMRLNNNGNPDSSFDDDGKLLVPVGNFGSYANSIAVQPDGKILVAGYSYNGNDNDFSIVRLCGNGDLDSSFDNDGKLLIPVDTFYDYLSSIVIQPDGKILLVGSSLTVGHSKISVVRLNSNGSLDTTFDGDGKLLLSVSGTYDHASSVALQPDGKILLGGGGYDGKHYDYLIARLNSNASLDSSFNGDGKLMIHLTGSDDDVNAIILQPDGKIFLAGYSNTGSSNSNLDNDFSIVRLNSSGSLDKSFDGDGKLILPVGSNEDVVRSIALQADGKILLAGRSYDGNYQDFSVVRLNSNGGLDNSFDGDGKLLIPIIGFGGYGNSVALQPDAKILLAGTGFNGSNEDFLVMRLNNNGTPDSSFNGDGQVLVPIGNSFDNARTMALQKDGKILVGGITHDATGFADHFSIIRLKSNGDPDSNFADQGKLLLPFDLLNTNIQTMAIQPDGKILLAGYGNDGNNYDNFLLVRLNTNGSIDSSFDGDGKLLISVGSFNDRAYSIAIQLDGKVLLAGGSAKSYYNANFDFSVVRLHNNGSLDSSFGTNGKMLIPITFANDYVNSIAIQPDGKILLAGKIDKSKKHFYSVVRLNSNGSLDNNFSGDGKFLLANANGWSSSVNLQPDGKILLAGTILNNASNDFLVVRLNNNGNLDKSFDGDGKAIVSTLEYSEEAFASVLQSDGKLLVIGHGEVDEPGTRLVAMRFLLCDNGACPIPKIKINNATVNEGNKGTKNMSFSVILSQASSQTITVQYTTQDGTAKSTNDYVAISGTVVFTPGITEKNISIKINGDIQAEPDETFRVNLSNAVNATIIDAKGIGTISNDDGTAIASTGAADLLQENNDQQSVKIYPKPASTVLKIELLGYLGKVSLQLQNLEGKIFKQQELAATNVKYRQYQLDLTGVAGGIYFLRVFDEHGKRHTEKVVVSR